MSGEAMTEAAASVCEELQPLLRDYAREAGLSPELAQTLTLTWDGDNFLVQSDADVTIAEYGDGRGPAPRPIHKAMNRLHLDAEALLEKRLFGELAQTVEEVRY